jgi:DNA-binding NarL/FixJ family response regulator
VLPDPATNPAAGTEPVRVFVVGDDELFRSGLCGLLSNAGLEIVGEASNWESAREVLPGLSPDVVAVDESLPGTSGPEAVRRLAHSAPGSHVVLLTIASGAASVTSAIAAGARGYLLKDSPADDMIAAVRAAAAGSSAISPRAAAALFEQLRADAREGGAEEHEQAALTERETEVLRGLVAGKSNGQIARELLVSPRTVKHHVSSVLAKLGVENRVQAAVLAVRQRLG